VRVAVLAFAFLLSCLQGALAQPVPVGEGYCAKHVCRALLIGNDTYQGPEGWKFSTSVPAVQNVDQALRDVGFETTVRIDSTREEMLSEIRGFSQETSVDVSLIFYAGNGVSADDVPLMLAADITVNGMTEETYRYEGIPYQTFFGSHPGRRLNINIYDTGTVPLEKIHSDAAATKGFGKVDLFADLFANMHPRRPGVETISLFSARRGQAAYDSPLFGELLAGAIRRPGDVLRALAQVAEQMAVETNLGQYPEVAISTVSGESVCLVSCGAVTKGAGKSISEVRQELEKGVCTGDLESDTSGQERFALVIGNNGYQNNDAWGRLTQPVNDADRIADALSATGFTVRKCHNATLSLLREETRNFQEFYDRQVEAAPVGVTPAAFFYFSGHGGADSEGNYLIPTDSEADEADELGADAVSVEKFTSRFVNQGGQIMVVIDACRNALKSSDNKSDFKGMTRIKAWPNMIVASATQPGALARQDSGYATLLAERITRPGIPFYESEARFVFDDVGKAVEKNTEGEQRPVVDSQFSGRFYFQTQTPAAQ
jgi:uncharacterized caspase-like protein